MRLRLALAALLVALAPAATAAATIPFRATLTAPTHSPPADNKTKWRYTLRVTDLQGQPIPATVTMQIVDPIGSVHPVEFDCCKRNIVNHPFTGVFRDAAEWPPESRGFRLVLRAVVRAKGAKRIVTYWVRPR
jgi:hypothetical protein